MCGHFCCCLSGCPALSWWNMAERQYSLLRSTPLEQDKRNYGRSVKMINEEPSLLQEHSLFSADTCKASQGSIAGRCLFTSTQSHNDSTHFEIRPLHTHTHTHTCVHAHTHTCTYTQSPKCGYSILYPHPLATGDWPKESYLSQTESIKFSSGIWNSGHRNMAVGNIQLKSISCKNSGRFTSSRIQTCLPPERASVPPPPCTYLPTGTGWMAFPHPDSLET